MTSTPAEHANVAVLEALYADLSTIGRYLAPDVVLHAAERELPGAKPTHIGRDAVVAKELDLIRATAGTLDMDVDQIIANNHFGAVTGRLRARKNGHDIAMPFCGLWRFRDGKIIEHWENAYDAAAFGAFLTGSNTSTWITARAEP